MSASGSANGGNGFVGRAMRRKEDPRLITGRARYTEDVTVAGRLWAAFVRSPEAHARIVSIDVDAARERPGIQAVFTGADMEDITQGLPHAWVPPGVEVNTPDHWPLARDTVKHVGDPVALVIGRDRYAVVDAAGLVSVEYDPLPVVTDPEAALQDGSPLVHEQFGTNRIHHWTLGGGGDVEAALAASDVVVERRVVNHRTSGAPIEPRAVLADYAAGGITVTTSTQVPNFVRLFISLILGISEERVRVIAPEVGGGFGAKLQVYGEEIALAWASRRLERPVKWVETRSEHMMVSHHGRDQIATFRIGATRDGRITAMHADIVADMGAYLMLLTAVIPSLGAFVMGGVYDVPVIQTDITGVFTNKCPTDAIRGAGRPEATHMIEVCVDQLAAELGIDPLELRRRNFIGADTFPHTTALGMVYDSGNYAGALDRLLEHVDPAAVRREAEELRERGIHRGIGFSTYTEICGLAASRRGCGSRRWCACTSPAPSPSTPAHRRTARATRPASRRSWRTASGSTPSRWR
jgi:carbon-monoxide dehydrogenase large subunit